MPPKAAQPPEPGHTCTHPRCCGHETAGVELAAGNQALALPDQPETEIGGLRGSLKRYILWFLAFFGIYASSSVCPFCGTPGCPVGAGGAALVGGVFACLWQYGKGAWKKFKKLAAKIIH